MKRQVVVCLLAAVLLVCAASFSAFAQSYDKISAPYSHKNLSIYLIHGKDAHKGKNILTLQEAMEQRVFAVYETSDVNELEVENLSKEFDVFIQSGDIVKGGKQDRVLAVSIIIPARSGRIQIAAFCVESGRWQKRGSEEAGKFSSSNERIVSNGLKLAANSAQSQSEVWKEVEKSQDKLTANVGATVNAAESKTSLQLSLENKKVKATTDEYIRKLAGIVEGKSDVIGYAFVINGEIYSADIYASNDLFKKLWTKLLRATAVEAVAELVPKAKFDEVSANEIKDFLNAADRAAATEKSVTSRMKILTRDEKSVVLFEARDNDAKVSVHKSYVKKQ